MQLVSTVLEIYGVRHRLTDGTILGLYRDNQFIPHDHDIDFDILINSNQEISLIKKNIKRNGFLIGRIAVFNGELQQIVFYDSDSTIIDLVFWRKDGDNIKNFSEKGYVRSQPAKYFEGLERRLFFGKSYFIPTPIEPWLVLRYNDWKTPKVYTDWLPDCGDIQKLND